MATASDRSITHEFTGDINYSETFEAVRNSASPAAIQVQALSAGANTITVPTGATGCTIIPPDNNSQTLTLKGVTGDTGIALALTSPTSLGLSGVSSFVITAGGTVTVRLIFS